MNATFFATKLRRFSAPIKSSENPIKFKIECILHLLLNAYFIYFCHLTFPQVDIKDISSTPYCHSINAKSSLCIQPKQIITSNMNDNMTPNEYLSKIR